MQRCSSSHQGNMGGQCTCGLFHGQTSNSFSMLFSMPPNKPYDEFSDYSCPFATASSSSYSSAVDCTLSLGTPSTRLSNENINNNYHNTDSCTNNNNNGKAAARSSYMPNFCWDILQPKHNPSPPSHKPTRGGNTNVTADPLLARRCANCDTTSTPLWRNGPRGPKSLCNACGIRFKKEERRATAAATTSTTTSGGAQADSNSWIHHQYSQSSNQKIPCLSTTSFGNEFRFMDHDHDDRDSETGIPFLSWRLNVTDRPGLVHDFTR